MFSSLSSYIWPSGSEDQTVPDLSLESMKEQQAEDEWILVDFVKDKSDNKVESKQRRVPTSVPKSAPKSFDIMEESWYVTPPSCFNASQEESFSLQTSPLENLLIEHPSMSVYGGPTEPWLAIEESLSQQTTGISDEEPTRETALDSRTHSHRIRAVRTVDKAVELTRSVQKNVLDQTKKQYRKKKLQKLNQTHTHTTRSRRKLKKVDRKQGKHSTVYSNRGC